MENQNTIQPTQQQGNHVQILVLGIIGLALASTGIAGLIVSIIALVKSNAYVKTYGTASRQARIGRILAIVGLILSIVCIVTYIICGIVFAVVAAHYGPEISQAVSDAVESGTYNININF